MGKQSGFLQRQKDDKNALIHSAEVLSRQYMMDTLLITMHKRFGWGFDRLMLLLDEWEKTREEYREALNPIKSNEADVKQAHMDRAISAIIKGRMPLIPFEERYLELKPVTYDKGRKKK